MWPVPGQKTLFPGVERERRKPLHLPAASGSLSVGWKACDPTCVASLLSVLLSDISSLHPTLGLRLFWELFWEQTPNNGISYRPGSQTHTCWTPRVHRQRPSFLGGVHPEAGSWVGPHVQNSRRSWKERTQAHAGALVGNQPPVTCLPRVSRDDNKRSFRIIPPLGVTTPRS